MKVTKVATAERILDAAVQLFSRHGINGTTTQEIARVANINEGTLFRYFPHKVDLFWAAMHSQVGKLKMRRELQTNLAADADPRIVLPLIVEFLVHIVLYQPALLRLLLFSVLELRADAEPVCRRELGPIFHSINAYLERCAKRGAINPVDASITTLAFASTVIGHGALFPLLTGNSLPHSSADEAISAYSALWLTCLLPPSNPVAWQKMNVGSDTMNLDSV